MRSTHKVDPAVQVIHIFIDGTCRMCNGFADFVANRKQRNLDVRFGALHSLLHSSVLARWGITQSKAESIAVIREGECLLEAPAILAILACLERPWPLVGTILGFLPTRATTLLYRAVSSKRYQLFGRATACTAIDVFQPGASAHSSKVTQAEELRNG